MKWIRLWCEQIYCGTTFEELNIYERGIWFSLLVAAGVRSNNGIIPAITVRRLFPGRKQRVNSAFAKLQRFDKIFIKQNGDIEIKNWATYQTRYEKYYKGNQKPIQQMMAYTCHAEEEVEVEERRKENP